MMNNLPEKSFEVSVASIKDGNHVAFLDFYNSLHKKTFHFFLKKVSLQEEAKDLTQQTFIRVWQFRHTLSEAYTLDKQLFVIAHSVLVNYLEKELRRKKFTQAYPSKEVQLYEPQIHFELSNRLHTAIESLPPVRKKILHLKANHDYSNKEIAQQLDISVKTVEDHVTQAFRRIKELIPLVIIISRLF